VSSNPSNKPGERDPLYYLDDDPTATWVFRAGDVLFKVHQETLQCSQDMNDLLKEHIRTNGCTSDERPLLFSLATPEESRAFLWALYARSEDLAAPPQVQSDIERFCNLASISSKYYIPKLQDWVLSAIHQTANNTIFMDSCSSATLSALLDVSVQFKRKDITETIQKKWYDRLVNQSAPSVPAIQAADKYDLEDIRGMAYYIHVQDMLDRQGVTGRGATQLRADPKLNNGQVMRLLSGYWSLVSLWERSRLKPIEMPQASSCTSETHQRCSATWERRWVSATGWRRILGLNSADVLGLLACLRDQLSGDEDLKTGANSECRLAALEALKALKVTVQDGLADHFFGCV